MTPPRLLHTLCAVLLTVAAPALHAQTADSAATAAPHITPVRAATNRTLPPPRGTDEKVIEQYLSGDTAKALAEARRDSLRRAYTRYPTLTDWSVHLNFIEPVLMAFGRDYASIDAGVTVNLWNRLQPTVEVGIGWANSTPDGLNFTYHGKAAPYVRLGANYNLLFKSEPRYQAVVGVRLGYTRFGYDITDIHYHNTYWQEEQTLQITGERSHALWGEALAGIKVGIYRQWSLGWTVRLHGIFSYGKNEQSKPWFVPGYGPRTGRVAFTFSLYRTFGGPPTSAGNKPDNNGEDLQH